MFLRKKPHCDSSESISPNKFTLNQSEVTWTGHLTFMSAALIIISRCIHCAIVIYAFPWRWFNVDNNYIGVYTLFDDWNVMFIGLFAWFSVIKARRRWIVVGYCYGFFSVGVQIWAHVNLSEKRVYLWPPPKEYLLYVKWCRIFLASVMGINQLVWTSYLVTSKTPF